MTSPLLSLASVLLLVAALHSVVLSVVLARSRREPAAARWCLAGLTLVMGLLIANLGLVFSDLSWGSEAVAAVINSLWLAVAPLFYGYVRSLLPGRARWEPEDLVHALPLALQLFSHAALRFAPASRPDAVEAAAPIVGLVFVSLFAIQSVVYAVVAVRLVAGFAARYRREAAGAADETLVGLRRLTVLFGVYAGAMGVNLGVVLVRGSFVLWVDYLVPLAMAALISAVGYGLLRRPEAVLPPLSLPEPPAPSSRTDAPRTPSRETDRHAERLLALMETERPYLNPEIRLGDLASSLGVSERTLSQVLADAIGGSFYDVVNGYRVAEAKARLVDPAFANRTVLSIGLDAGFSSKASFNRVFKKQAGETPSAYRSRAGNGVATAAALEVVVGGDGVSRATADAAMARD